MMENSHLNDIQLFEYASGELVPTERAAAEHHLASCEECSSLLALAQAGSDALRAAPQFELPAATLERTLDALGSQELEPAAGRARFSMQRWLSFLAPTAAIAGVVLVVIFVVRGGDAGDSTSESAAPAPAAEPAAAAEPNDRSVQGAASEEPALESTAADSLGGSDAAAELESEPAPAEAPAPAADAAAEPPEAVEAPSDPLPAAPETTLGPQTPADEPAASGEESSPLALLDGPADDIVDLLAEAGITAVVAPDGSVEIVEADVDAALEVLAFRDAGDVPLRLAAGAAP